MVSFDDDARGHWYCKIGIEIVESAPQEDPEATIDPGLKDLAKGFRGLQGGSAIDDRRRYRNQTEAAPPPRPQRPVSGTGIKMNADKIMPDIPY